MKNSCVFLILIMASSFNCFSQLNILDNGKDQLWYIVRTTNLLPPGSIHEYETTVLKLGGSVIKSDNQYLALLYTKDIDLLTWDTIGFIREADHQVFYRPFSKNTESLLYDFNIMISSTVTICNPFFKPIQLTVANVDSIQVGSHKRRRISFNDPLEIWIEGIGSLKGLTNSGLYIDGARYELSCYLENGNILYHNPTYTNCFCLTGINSVFNSNSNLYFANGNVYLLGDVGDNFELFDLSGVKILSFQSTSSRSVIDVSNLKSGLYLFKIVSKNTQKIGKMIKE